MISTMYRTVQWYIGTK